MRNGSHILWAAQREGGAGFAHPTPSQMDEPECWRKNFQQVLDNSGNWQPMREVWWGLGRAGFGTTKKVDDKISEQGLDMLAAYHTKRETAGGTALDVPVHDSLPAFGVLFEGPRRERCARGTHRFGIAYALRAPGSPLPPSVKLL
jgi:hypothetical protein